MYQQHNTYSEVGRLAIDLYTDKHRYLMNIARRNAVNEADAEEALQEAFGSFICHFDPEGGAPPLAWVTLCLKRQCWRRRRDAHLDRYVGQEAGAGEEEVGFVLESIPSFAPGPAQCLIEREDARRRLRCLRPDERTALLLRAAGFSRQEIGGHRDWSERKVNRCMSEGRATLRKLAPA